jgi:hypothetical protein
MLTTCRQSVCKIGGSAEPVKLKIALFFGIAPIVAGICGAKGSDPDLPPVPSPWNKNTGLPERAGLANVGPQAEREVLMANPTKREAGGAAPENAAEGSHTIEKGPIEARQGFRGKPVLYVLLASLLLAIGAYLVLQFYYFGTAR